MGNNYLYETIVSDLKQKIKGGELEKGAKVPTEAELVEQYQVSRTTVIKALNDLKKSGYVVRYPKKGTFVAGPPSEDDGADASAERKSVLRPIAPISSARKIDIAFIIPTISDTYALNLIRGISSVFHRHGYRLMILQSYSEEAEADYLTEVMEVGAAGVILFPVDHPYYSDAILYIRLSDFPIVLVDRMMEKINLDFVVGDNRLGGRLVAEHLYALGHRKIALLTSCVELPSSVQDRIRGMRDYLLEQGLGRDAVSVYDSFIYPAEEGENEELLGGIIADGNTALVASESGTALFAYGLLREMGIRIPEDISLVSFDNPGKVQEPFDIFTYVDQSEEKMGETAAEMVYKRINHRAGDSRQVVIEPKLVVNKTSGPARKQN